MRDFWLHFIADFVGFSLAISDPDRRGPSENPLRRTARPSHAEYLRPDAELAALVNPRIEQQQDRLIEAAGRDQVRILRFGQQADSMTEGPIRAISLAPDLAAQAIAAGLPPVSFRPYLQAVMLEQALIACGRDLTRACVEAALPRIDMAPFLHLYTLDN